MRPIKNLKQEEKQLAGRNNKNKQAKEALDDLIEMIDFTEKVSTKIYGLKNRAEIFRAVKKEFQKSKRLTISILLLTKDGNGLAIREIASPARNLGAGERVAGVRLKDYKIDLNKSTIYNQVVKKKKTVHVTVNQIVEELFPRALARLILRVTDYQNKPCILMPLNQGGEIIGALAISSPELAEYFIPSVKNLIRHISTALDLMEYEAERERIARAKIEFVSLASHQLRGPLTTMRWYGEALLSNRTGKLVGQQEKYVEKIYATNQYLIRLVNNLLNASRIELGILPIEPKPMDLTKIINSVLFGLDSQIKNKKVRIEKNYQKHLAEIKLDPKLTEIIFQNLLSNAVRYTPPGGKVMIGIGKDKADILVKITDSGYGIPRNQQSRVFTKFFRGDNIREKEPNGTGLSLYLVKAIIDQSGGNVQFKSKENRGTTFEIRIPLKGMKRKKPKKKNE